MAKAWNLFFVTFAVDCMNEPKGFQTKFRKSDEIHYDLDAVQPRWKKNAKETDVESKSSRIM